MKKFKKPELKLLKEFKAFITKGNVVDLAVGMIIGAAFTAIVTALVNNIFKPLINAIPMGDLQGLITMLVAKNAEGLTAAECAQKGVEFVVDMTKSVYIDWGAFIMAIINFLITALVLFAMVKLINMVRGGFTGLRRDTKFLESLTPEEKATIKGKIATKKELRAIKAARDAAAEQAAAEAAAKAEAEKPETTDDLLREIRDLLKAQQLQSAQKLIEDAGVDVAAADKE
ncbi:MAG: large conductance mechanosensitive channel protein MscL [Christensenella sp.]|nr:MAG: large conductance mechanosensitive channel protein MscL [Christensenella sp.]